MGIFCSLFYAPWFLRLPLASAAPYFDLKAIEEMRSARAYMTDEADAALAKIVVPGPKFCTLDKFWPGGNAPSLASFVGKESLLML